jgi:hypothetical protein
MPYYRQPPTQQAMPYYQQPPTKPQPPLNSQNPADQMESKYWHKTPSETTSNNFTEQPMKFRDEKPFLETPYQYKIMRNLDIEARKQLHIQQNRNIEEFNIIEQKIKKTYNNYYNLSVTNSWHTGDSKNTEMFLQSQDDYEEYLEEVAERNRVMRYRIEKSQREQQIRDAEEQHNITLEQIQQKRLARQPHKTHYDTQSQVTSNNSSQYLGSLEEPTHQLPEDTKYLLQLQQYQLEVIRQEDEEIRQQQRIDEETYQQQQIDEEKRFQNAENKQQYQIMLCENEGKQRRNEETRQEEIKNHLAEQTNNTYLHIQELKKHYESQIAQQILEITQTPEKTILDFVKNITETDEDKSGENQRL